MTPEYLKNTSGPLHTMGSREAERRALADAMGRFLARGGEVKQVEIRTEPVRPTTATPFSHTGSPAAKRQRRAARELEDRAAPVVRAMAGQQAIVIVRHLRTLGINLQSERVEQIAARELVALAEPTKPAGNRRRA